MLLSEIVNNVTLIDYDRLNNSNVYIFGAGKGGRLTEFALKTLGIVSVHFIDNNESLWGSTLMGKKILDPITIKHINKDHSIVLIASSFVKPIVNQLISMGLNEQCFADVISPRSKINPNSDMYTNTHVYKGVKIGRYSYGFEVLCTNPIGITEIGSFCSINSTAYFGVNHPTDKISSSPYFYLEEGIPWGKYYEGVLTKEEIVPINKISKNEPTIIGHDVWIGARAVILPGIRIGNGAVIGAGAVVTKHVPDFAIVGGVPAKIIKYRFSPEEITMLNQIKWWDWPIEKIRKNAGLFMHNKEFFKVALQLEGD